MNNMDMCNMGSQVNVLSQVKPVKQHMLTQIMNEIINENTLYKFRFKLLNKRKQCYSHYSWSAKKNQC